MLSESYIGIKRYERLHAGIVNGLLILVCVSGRMGLCARGQRTCHSLRN